MDVKSNNITLFLNRLECTNGGKHAYFRALRAFYNWLYSRKSGYNLNSQDNPISLVDTPKLEQKIMPTLTEEQVNTLINAVDNDRDKCIISLLSDSGMRLNELATITVKSIDWSNYTITVWGKGNKQRRAPFTNRSAVLLQVWLSSRNGNSAVWDINKGGIEKMLKQLRQKTGIQCNAHSFRRGFACNLHRKGLSTLDIMHLGGWSDLSMVLRYTRSITFEDCLEHYKRVTG